MNKKTLGIGVVFISVIALVLAGAYYFLGFVPAQEKKQIENFYEEIDTFDSLNKKVETIDSSINVEVDATFDESVSGFSTKSFIGIAVEFDILAKELENADVPDDLKESVDELLIDLDAISDDMEDLEDVFVYLTEVTSIMESFAAESQSYSDSLGASLNTDDLDEIIVQFNIAVGKSNEIINNFKTELGSVEVPESAESFHLILGNGFDDMQATMNSIFGDLLGVLEFSSRVVSSPQTLTAADFARAENIETELNDALARVDEIGAIGSRFDDVDTVELFELEKYGEDFEQALTRIANNLEKLESYRAEKL